MKKPSVLVVGSANIDLIARAPRCPKPGESLVGESFAMAPGGKGANQAVACARLGANTFFGGAVGDDLFGKRLLSSLVDAGVDVTYLSVEPMLPTGTALIVVSDSGENSIVVTPAANFSLKPEDVERMFTRHMAFDVVVVQLEIPLEAVQAALKMGRKQGAFTILDAGPARPLDGDILRWVDLLSPNAIEAETISGLAVDSPESAAEVAELLGNLGPKDVVLKLGGEGALYWDGLTALRSPAFSVSAIDTVGAGDAFTAALACFWNAEPPEESLALANAAGALATTVQGAQPAMPSLEQVVALRTSEKALS